ncbi:MAG: hypothetical protein JO019_03925 [Candidatus Kaiserbacteria bacterium]|nr:hypothetical protein [Candidatus Kaiserbacteria bacterium]
MNSASTTYLVLQETRGNGPVTLSPLQKIMQPHEAQLETIWWCIWFITLCIVIARGVRNARR